MNMMMSSYLDCIARKSMLGGGVARRPEGHDTRHPGKLPPGAPGNDSTPLSYIVYLAVVRPSLVVGGVVVIGHPFTPGIEVFRL